jgi:hypothetical protein
VGQDQRPFQNSLGRNFSFALRARAYFSAFFRRLAGGVWRIFVAALSGNSGSQHRGDALHNIGFLEETTVQWVARGDVAALGL